MATRIWRGDAQATYDVWTLTFTLTWATNDTVTLTVNGKDLLLTVGAAATVTDVAAAVEAAWNGDALVGTETRTTTGPAVPEFAEYTADATAGVVVFTKVNAGEPGTISVASNTAGNGDAAIVHTTTATGPNYYDNAENWDDGSGGSGAPGAGDTVRLQNSSVDILYGLSNAGATLTAMFMDSSYTGRIGLPEYNETGKYYEYRTRELAIDCSAFTAGLGDGEGSGRCLINFGTIQTAVKIHKTGSSLDSGVAAFRIRGTHASNTLEVSEGSVDVAYFSGQSATFATTRCGHEANPQSDVALRFGSGCTLTTINQSGGTLEVNSAFTTLTKTDGTFTRKGGGAVTTINNWKGDIVDLGSGTVTTFNLKGMLDRRQTMTACTYTTINIYEGSVVYDPFETLTFTNPANLKGCGIEDVELHLGFDIAIQRS